ncbi:hypothetical protein [Arthrobacter sp. UYCu712]|uniref:hypothetical protein n=1 Tax=Arthrobacter sp. UYCu712 TaxID=3156340 RepID=UPI00339387C1
MTVADLQAAMRHCRFTYGKPESVVDELFEAATDSMCALTSKTASQDHQGGGVPGGGTDVIAGFQSRQRPLPAETSGRSGGKPRLCRSCDASWFRQVGCSVDELKWLARILGQTPCS